MTTRIAGVVTGCLEAIRSALAAAPVAHFDETGQAHELAHELAHEFAA